MIVVRLRHNSLHFIDNIKFGDFWHFYYLELMHPSLEDNNNTVILIGRYPIPNG
jgi:hypothetical protein